jgi:hypothetical protein
MRGGIRLLQSGVGGRGLVGGSTGRARVDILWAGGAGWASVFGVVEGDESPFADEGFFRGRPRARLGFVFDWIADEGEAAGAAMLWMAASMRGRHWGRLGAPGGRPLALGLLMFRAEVDESGPQGGGGLGTTDDRMES